MHIDPDGAARRIANGKTIDVTNAVKLLKADKMAEDTADDTIDALLAKSQQTLNERFNKEIEDANNAATNSKLSPLAEKYQTQLNTNATNALSGHEENFDFSENIYIDNAQNEKGEKARFWCATRQVDN